MENLHIEILSGLGFIREHSGKDYERWRHELSEKYDKDFALVIYEDFDLEDILKCASTMLRKIGQKQKIDKLSKYL